MTRFREEVYNARWYRALVKRTAKGAAQALAFTGGEVAKERRTAYFEKKGRQKATYVATWRRLDGF